MTKKEFKSKCDVDHVYGRGKNRINTVYVDWKETEQGRGFKYAVASSLEFCTKAELLNMAYDWIENGTHLPYYVFSRFAQYDSQRFKTPITFNPQNWN